VVSLTGYALNNCSNTNQIDAISGNICRCTGYKSIEKAANIVNEKITSNNIDELINQDFIPNYFKTILERLKKFNPETSRQNSNLITPVIPTEGGTTDEESLTTVTVANGTDLYVRHADKLSEQNVQLIGNDNAFKGITFLNNTCKIGASTTVTEILENEQLHNFFPKLKSHLKLVSSEPIRNMGTLGGNFVNASPIGDLSIFFLALNSTLEISNSNNEIREIPFQKFHQDYKKYDLQKNELIKSIAFKVFDKTTKFNFEKVSKRTHLDIASVNSACRIKVENNTIKEAFIAVGGVSAIPKYLEKTTEFIVSKTLSVKTVKEAEQIMQTEISPISDVRGTAAYKRLLARQLFFAHFIELFNFPQILQILAE
jgi:xanthine dehydrogenase small subunit